MSALATAPRRAPAATTLADRAARRIVLAALGRLRHGRLTVVEAGHRHVFGPGPGPDGLSATVTVHATAAFTAAAKGGSSGLGSSYADGLWDCDDLVALVRIIIRHLPSLERLPGVNSIITPLRTALSRRPIPDKEGDRRNIASHYDIGDDFFALFLDETMTYSCAVFDSPATTLTEASVAKLDRICSKLALQPDHDVLEIGSGWGSFAMHAAQRYGSRVTTTTISERQFDYASRRVSEAGLADRVRVLHDDYRDLTGTWDRLVSIEMIEAVDWRQYDGYFAACSDLLRPDGLMALQAIVIADQAFDRAKLTQDFIKQMVFPGGCLPSIEAIVRSATRASDLRLVDLEDLGVHYAHTLARWRQRLAANSEAAVELGYDERLVRLWNLYLPYCEAAFAERHISVVQIVLAKPDWRQSQLTTRSR